MMKTKKAKSFLELHAHDIYKHPEFQKLKEQSHHYTSNVFNHSVRVAETAGKLCKVFHVNPEKTRETVRAALLHDFYDFDRAARAALRKEQEMKFLERAKTCFLVVHPRSAANHAQEVFGINHRQMSAIRSHMFPLAPLPKNVDAWIITASDKYVSTKEGIEAYLKKDIFKW